MTPDSTQQAAQHITATEESASQTKYEYQQPRIGSFSSNAGAPSASRAEVERPGEGE